MKQIKQGSMSAKASSYNPPTGREKNTARKCISALVPSHDMHAFRIPWEAVRHVFEVALTPTVQFCNCYIRGVSLTQPFPLGTATRSRITKGTCNIEKRHRYNCPADHLSQWLNTDGTKPCPEFLPSLCFRFIHDKTGHTTGWR